MGLNGGSVATDSELATARLIHHQRYRTEPWRRTEAAEYRKKCRCRTNFSLAIRRSGIYVWFSISKSKNNTISTELFMDMQGVSLLTTCSLNFHMGIPFTSTTLHCSSIKGGHRHLQIGWMLDIDLISEPTPTAPPPRCMYPKCGNLCGQGQEAIHS